MKLFSFKKQKAAISDNAEEPIDDNDDEFPDEWEVIDAVSAADDAEITILLPSRKLRISAKLHADKLEEIENSDYEYRFSGKLYDTRYEEINTVERMIEEARKEVSTTPAWSAFDLSDR